MKIRVRFQYFDFYDVGEIWQVGNVDYVITWALPIYPLVVFAMRPQK